MEIFLKTFNSLTLEELYSVLRLRSEVFVVEQDCVYLDLDNKDQIALHVIGVSKGKVVAYTRIFKPGDYFDKFSIGRVVVDKNHRGKNYGKLIMNASINEIERLTPQSTIKLSAQLYLEKFYNNLGFVQQGTPYLEDGIPHIAMFKN